MPKHSQEMDAELYNEASHFEMLLSWWKSHLGDSLPLDRHILKRNLPSLGVVTRVGNVPKTCLFAYEDVKGNVAHLDWMVSRPGSELWEVRESFEYGHQVIEAMLREAGYSAIIVAPTKPISRYTSKMGYGEPIETFFQVKTF